ncbi:MAG: hypothetical protein PVJ04_14750 [Gemmatimonadota bacterium]
MAGRGLTLVCVVLAVELAPAGIRAQGAEDVFPHGPLPEGIGCADCHSTQGWSPLDPQRSFDHGEVTGFALLGGHGDVPCASCHQDLRFSAMTVAPNECGSCHLDVHQGALSADCSGCHTPESFTAVSGVRVHQTTGFPLEGAHLQLSCEACHSSDRGGAFSPIPADCMACHREEFEAPKLVDHVTLGFPGNCLACHSSRSWKEVGSFDHETFSGGFRLQGVHQGLPCTSCHLSGGGLRFTSPSGPEDCVSCHQADYQREHGGSGYPTTCTLCHSPSSWEGAEDDHAALSGGFALEGAHQDLACTDCHAPEGGESFFSPGGPQDCVSCHQADYQREHAGSGYPTTCITCHTVSSWEGAEGDHEALSGGFVLEGAHDGLACGSCHTADGSGTLFEPSGPDDCVSCHQADYQREHSGSGYPTTCLTCHTVSSWEGVHADHETLSGGFVLVGNHDQLACSSCHIEPSMESIFSPSDPEDCLACHQGDFQREHSGSGYPTTCLSCHLVTTWDGAEFDHDGAFFPIYTGSHQGQWTDCSNCHTVPEDLRIFSCLTCHEHNKTQTDQDHSEVGDYIYESGQCLACHPTGRSGG